MQTWRAFYVQKQHDFSGSRVPSAENRFGSLQFALGDDPFMPLGQAFDTVSRIIFVFGHETDYFLAAFGGLPDDSGNESNRLSNLEFMHNDPSGT